MKELKHIKAFDGNTYREVSQEEANSYSCQYCSSRKKPINQALLNRSGEVVAYLCREHGSDDEEVKELPEVPVKKVKQQPKVKENITWRHGDALYLLRCECSYSWFTNDISKPQRCSSCDKLVSQGEQISTVDVQRLNNYQSELSVVSVFSKSFPSTIEGKEIRILKIEEPTGEWKTQQEINEE
jgi:hypothetical protein